MEIFINKLFKIMKQKLKFFALVFGVTLAIFGSGGLTAQTKIVQNPGPVSPNEGARCDPPYTAKCTTIESPDGGTKPLSGKKVTW
jgi:hypothetical protein